MTRIRTQLTRLTAGGTHQEYDHGIKFGCAYGVVPQALLGFYSPHTSRTTVPLFFLQETLVVTVRIELTFDTV
jgi:hypothetical protein